MKKTLLIAVGVIGIAIIGFFVLDARSRDYVKTEDQSHADEQSQTKDDSLGDREETGDNQGILPYQSGIRGSVTVGPVCPVATHPPQPGCEDRPLETTVSIFAHGSDQPFVTTTTDTAGTYSVSLPPGTYTVAAGSESLYPTCTPVDVEVTPDAVVEANLSCDTGIR